MTALHEKCPQESCVRWAKHPDHAESVAIIEDQISGKATFHSYFELWQDACRLSNVLGGLGVQRGDRVAIVLPQRFETAVAYMGVMQAGAVGMPLSMLFGPEALAYRLQDSGANVAICDQAGLKPLLQVRAECPGLRHILVVGGELTDATQVDGPDGTGPMLLSWPEALAGASNTYTCVDTLADEPAVLIYTSGTTGNPKGGLIPHRALVGNLSGFVCSQNLFGFAPGPKGELPFPTALESVTKGLGALPTGSQAEFWHSRP